MQSPSSPCHHVYAPHIKLILKCVLCLLMFDSWKNVSLPVKKCEILRVSSSQFYLDVCTLVYWYLEAHKISLFHVKNRYIILFYSISSCLPQMSFDHVCPFSWTGRASSVRSCIMLFDPWVFSGHRLSSLSCWKTAECFHKKRLTNPGTDV